eukprot:NODE_1163_length_1626_cov_34.551034_g1094_i0.p1 GENE.NODE_1163_length_1626_cov_34.551034_g1094_i0~~NODE_1163_length_1626_cov_34.551034_g1094_i0.p1  ORF type:complete len:512 (-),score=137.23 NODE_1163_length_1626_cov_34.551034_g1094_i0:91-1584(-)
MSEVFPTIGEAVEVGEGGSMQVESMCPRCQHNGATRLLLVMVPFFREIIVSSFECANEECGERNTDVQFGGSMQPDGCEYRLSVTAAKDLNRQLIRSEHATIEIPELEFEIPAHRAEITTLESILRVSMEELQTGQAVRRIMYPEMALKIDDFLLKLQECVDSQRSFTFQIRDPSGNSFIQNPHAPNEDPHLKIKHFQRTIQDDVSLGLRSEEEPESELVTTPEHEQASAQDYNLRRTAAKEYASAQDYNTRRTAAEEYAVETGQMTLGYTIAETCHACRHPGEVKVAMLDIPHFIETLIFAFKCDACGFQSTEVKTGGQIPDHGTRLTLLVHSPADLSRDVLKSHSCRILIPELEFEMAEGSLGSMFTTVEGLVSQMLNQLSDVHKSGFALGDSLDATDKQRYVTFFETFNDMRDGTRPFTLILEDPLSRSYLQRLDEDGEDTHLTQHTYERTAEEEEEFGLTALKANDQASLTHDPVQQPSHTLPDDSVSAVTRM